MEFEKEIREFPQKESFTTNDLLTIIKILRSENGCPWDREQTHSSITQDLIEETYEFVEAIEAKNNEMLCEELGDVLLQVCFHTILSEEESAFTYTDAVTGVCKKMIERHPHVFGNVKAETTEKVLDNWDKIKSESKHQETLYDRLSAVPVTLPALMQAQKLIHRAAKAGETTAHPDYDLSHCEDKEKAIADSLWQLLSAAEESGIDAETALRHHCKDFVKAHKN